MLKYIKGYEKETVLAPLFKMLEALLELFVPLLVRDIIDSGIALPDEGRIFRDAALLAATAFTGLLFSVTAQYFAAKAAVGYAAKLRSALFRHIGTLSCPDVDRLGTSGLITRMTADVNQVQSGLNLSLRLLLRSPFVVFGAMIMAFAVDRRSALTFTVTVAVLSVIVFSVMLSSLGLYKTVRKDLDEVTSQTRSALNGVRVIRAFGREMTAFGRFAEANEVLNDASRKAGRISALINPLTYVVVNAGIIALIGTGALRVESGLLSEGALVALYNYMGQILVELIKLADLIINITKALASADRIKEVFGTKPSVVYPESGEAEGDSPFAVEFDRVSFTYPGAAEPSVSDITFSVRRGEKIGLIGATGSGKTTLINLIPRYYDASSGGVRLFGKPVGSYSADALNRLVAVAGQKAVLFRGTVEENLRWGDENADEEKITAALTTAQASDFILSRPDGIRSQVEEKGKNFSGGQKQRLSVARALMKDAPLLILDDTSSALDAATDHAMRNALNERYDGRTVITVSQRVSSVKDCDRIIVTDDGTVAGTGTHEELLRSCPLYEEICRSQMKGGGAE